jgi:hypothetical protein
MLPLGATVPPLVSMASNGGRPLRATSLRHGLAKFRANDPRQHAREWRLLAGDHPVVHLAVITMRSPDVSGLADDITVLVFRVTQRTNFAVGLSAYGHHHG